MLRALLKHVVWLKFRSSKRSTLHWTVIGRYVKSCEVVCFRWRRAMQRVLCTGATHVRLLVQAARSPQSWRQERRSRSLSSLLRGSASKSTRAATAISAGLAPNNASFS